MVNEWASYLLDHLTYGKSVPVFVFWFDDNVTALYSLESSLTFTDVWLLKQEEVAMTLAFFKASA